MVVVVVAALNLVLDFDFIEQGAKSGAPKYMEWYGAFGLLVTLVWLYLEILRLLSKLNSAQRTLDPSPLRGRAGRAGVRNTAAAAAASGAARRGGRGR